MPKNPLILQTKFDGHSLLPPIQRRAIPRIGKGKYGTTGHLGSPSDSNHCQIPAGGAKNYTKSFQVEPVSFAKAVGC